LAEAPASAWVGAAFARQPPPELAVIVPTLNERDNIAPLLAKLAAALDGLDWEAVFVDDDSEDGTWALLQEFERRLPHVRTLRRIGRRGLASACVEGMLATTAPYLAVIDADLQHDETILPTMLATLKARRLDAVVGTRFLSPGSVGEFGRGRLLISRLGRLLSRAVTRAELSDPMSGYFVVDRAFFEETVRRLSAHGFKILLDLFASSPRRVRFAEVPYRFRARAHGASKLDGPVLLEYVALLGDKLLGRYVPFRFIRFFLVGLFGVVIHLAVLALCFRHLGIQFYYAQIIATVAAITLNFNLNNAFTYRDRRLRGWALLRGQLSFYLICTIGAIFNFQVAAMLFSLPVPWALAGLGGAAISSIWNYAVSSVLTWRSRERTPSSRGGHEPMRQNPDAGA
jgi:dolichol-phosphate mannosyltransferase